MRPVFCGNFEYETRHGDLERLFSKYGRVDRVDMKSGILMHTELYPGSPSVQKPSMSKETFLPAHQILPFTSGYAFIYYEDERDAEYAIRNLDNMPFGHSRRRLSVEWSRGERGPRHRDGSRSMSNMRPTKTLFVINFDPIRTRDRDIERHFEPYGKIMHVRIRRNFAFVQFETQEEATKALECTNMSKIMDRVVSVEYALRDDSERDDRRDGPRRGYGRRDDSPYGRSPSPGVRRGRPSPDYGRGPSPDYGRRPSPDYGRRPSPGYVRRPSPDYVRRPSPDYVRRPSPGYIEASPEYGGRYRSRSPIRRSRT